MTRKQTRQGETGFGHDFVRGEPLLGLGVNGPFIGAGIDGYLNFSIVPYLNIHSQDRFKKPSNSTQECLADTGRVIGNFTSPTCTGPVYFPT